MRSLTALSGSFIRHQKAQGRQPNTILLYRLCTARFVAYAGDDLDAVTRRTITDYIGTRLEQVKASSASIDFRTLRVFFGWLVAEGELTVSPFERLRQPKVRVTPPALFSEADLSKMLRACEGSAFRDRRDMAILRLLADSGLRRGELAAMTLSDLDLDNGLAVVSGKTGQRTIAFGSQTAQALDRYVRLRARTTDAERPELWLGRFGPLTGNAVLSVVRRRARQAGVAGAFVHRFRHGFAHKMLAAGMSEGDLMRLGGWQSRSMLDRYGASAASARAIDAYRKLVA